MSDADEESDPYDLVAVRLDVMEWAEVCAALKGYIRTLGRRERNSRRDALHALQVIDAAMLGSDTLAPPDDLLGSAP